MGADRLLLLDHFRRLYGNKVGRNSSLLLTPEAEARWASYQFPGNVRELRNIVVRLIAKHEGRPIGLADLEAELDSDMAAAGTTAMPRDDEQLTGLALRHLRETGNFSLDETLRRWEAAYIAAAQQLTHGNISQAAKLLGVNRTTLYNRIEVLARPPGDVPEAGGR
jgi:two-component system nitrogen regulation response regulator GlnG